MWRKATGTRLVQVHPIILLPASCILHPSLLYFPFHFSTFQSQIPISNHPAISKMASFLASIFGTELDKVNCSFYFVCILNAINLIDQQLTNLENRRLPPW